MPDAKQKRGFALIDPDRQREIAAMGGAAVPAHMRSFSRNPEYAKRAGSIGGKAYRPSEHKS